MNSILLRNNENEVLIILELKNGFNIFSVHCSYLPILSIKLGVL
jgi:hypothetical protein